MESFNVVLPKDGYFWVGVLTPKGLDAVKVTDEPRCACGGSRDVPCSHIQAVRAYMRLEGGQVPEETGVVLPDVCPICGASVIAQADHWRCTASPGHYWQHRGEQSGVKAFLTQPHPAKHGAFYEQSIEEREAFLESISHRRYGYSPYHAKGA